MSIDNAEEYNAGVHFRRSGPREYHFHKRILKQRRMGEMKPDRKPQVVRRPTARGYFMGEVQSA